MTAKAMPSVTPMSRVWHQIRYAVWWISRSKAAMIGIIIVGTAVVVAATADLIMPHPYQEINLSMRLLPPFWVEGGTGQYPLGTDDLGRCLLSRIIYGTRTALIVGGLVTILAVAVGVFLGLISGYLGGVTDAIIMRLVDVQWSFPYFLLALAIMALLGPSFTNLIMVLTLSAWVSYARTVRGLVMSLKEEEFITAAISVGAKTPRILLRHLLPNSMAPILVLASFSLASIIITEASLSFLGLGVQPPTPSWGAMISSGRVYMFSVWWLVTLPGLALMLLVLGVNQLGDGLRDLLDPRLRGVL